MVICPSAMPTGPYAKLAAPIAEVGMVALAGTEEAVVLPFRSRIFTVYEYKAPGVRSGSVYLLKETHPLSWPPPAVQVK